MIKIPLLLCVLGLMIAASLAAAMPGGYSPASVTDKEVVAAAEFAVGAQEKALQEEKSSAPVKLKLVKILRAQQQVVAGTNFLLTLKVTLNGRSKQVEAVVWWQAWRKPDPYRLMSWKWKKNEAQSKPDAGNGL